MSRASGRTWQNWVTGMGIVAVVLLSGWWWHSTAILQSVSAQEASPYAGMVEIPGSSFTMGRDDGPTNERPAHQVFLPTFYIDRNLVTVEEFATFTQAKGPTGPQGEMYLDVHDPDNRIQHVMKVDFIVCKATPYRHEEFARCSAVEIDGVIMWLVTAEDLLLSKLVWTAESRSEMQLQDVRNLIRSVADLERQCKTSTGPC